MPVFFASFRFEHPPSRYGRFEIAAEAASMHQAERQFRKKIGSCFSEQPPSQRPVSVYLLDVIEITEFSQAVLMNLSSVREDETDDTAGENIPDGQEEGVHKLFSDQKSDEIYGSVVFSGLPMREPNAQHWSVSMPHDPDCFMLID